VLRRESGWLDTAAELGAEWIYFRGSTPILQRANESK